MSKTNRPKNRDLGGGNNSPPQNPTPQTPGATTPAPMTSPNLAAQAGLEGSSLLTELPNSTIGEIGDQPSVPSTEETRKKNLDLAAKTEPSPSDSISQTQGALSSKELIRQLTRFTDETQRQYDSLDGELQLALAWQGQISDQQEDLNRRIEIIKQRVRAERLVFDNNAERVKEILAQDVNDEPPRTTGTPAFNMSPLDQGPATHLPAHDDVISYATPAPPAGDRFHLFRPRSPGEDTEGYTRRTHEQHHSLARDHYEEGVRQRNANAERVWSHIESSRPEWPKQEEQRITGTPPPTSMPPARVGLSSARPAPDTTLPGRDAYARAGPVDDRLSRTGLHHHAGDDEDIYTAYDREKDYFLLPDHDDPNSPYARHQLELIRAAIRERVGRDVVDSAATKNLKNVPAPDKYGGEDDAEAFLSWMKAFLRWLVLGRIVGPGLDHDRVYLLGQYLTKEARSWYDDAIDSLDGVGRAWTFEQAICALYRRFIHRSTARSAAERFHTTRYKKETGVIGLWDLLWSLARKMPRVPDDYTFKHRFVDALPEDIGVPMFRYGNVSMEQTSPSGLRRAALQQEENNRTLEEYRASRRGTPTKDQERPARTAERPAAYARGATTTTGTANAWRPSTGGRPAAVGPPQGGYRASMPGGARNAPAAATMTRGGPMPPKPTPPPPGATPNTQCYNCKEFGHMAAQCPKAQVPRLRAARVVDEQGLESPPTFSPPPAITPQEPTDAAGSTEQTWPIDADEAFPEHQHPGLTYESDEEYSHMDVDGTQYDPEDDFGPPFSDHGDNDAWFGSMRIVPTDTDEAVPPSAAPTLDNELVTPASRNYSESLWASIRADMRSIPMGEARSPAAFLADEDDTYDDIPPLIPISEIDAPVYNRAPQRTTPIMATRRGPDTYVDDYMVASTGPDPYQWLDNVEIPIGDADDDTTLSRDLDWAWTSFVDSERSDEDLTRILAVLYRMTSQNERLTRELRDSRNSSDALRASLGWTRHELAIALFRESEGLNITRRRTTLADDQRLRVRTRIRTETHPLELRDDELDERDEPHRQLELPEANDLLLSVIDGGTVPPLVGMDPPGYERVVRLFAITTIDTPGSLATRARAGRRPLSSEGEQECIVLLLTINGLGALTLFDAGSTTELLSNDFARVSKCDIIKLDNPATLQLGCAGSRSRINFGTRSPVTVGHFGAEVYFDIANLDRYDAVLGTPFLRRFGVMLDFKNNCVHIDGQSYPALSRAQVTAVLSKRNSRVRAQERPALGGPSSAPPESH